MLYTIIVLKGDGTLAKIYFMEVFRYVKKQNYENIKRKQKVI